MKNQEVADIKLVWKQKELEKFWAFMTERYNMWYRKHMRGRGYPWTKDPVLTKYKFCNVYRRLDAGSVYVKNILYSRGSWESIIFNVMLYRLFNLPYTYELLGGFKPIGGMEPFNALAARLVDAKNRGHRLFNDAYLTAPGNDLNGRIKAVGYLDAIYHAPTGTNRFMLREIARASTMYDAWNHVQSFRFFGPFIAYQVVLDLMESDKVKWDDDKSFVYVGPGAKSSMDGFLEARYLTKWRAAKINSARRYKDKVYDKAISELVSISKAGLKKAKFGWDEKVNWAGRYFDSAVDIHDIEFCCCEYRKYKNIHAMLRGGRRVKLRTYPGVYY